MAVLSGQSNKQCGIACIWLCVYHIHVKHISSALDITDQKYPTALSSYKNTLKSIQNAFPHVVWLYIVAMHCIHSIAELAKKAWP